MKLLDLYCGAGGCSVGYERAGFDVVGVDLRPIKYYPNRFQFIQADALEVLRDKAFISQFDVIHASPVCKKYSVTSSLHNNEYPDDIPEIRKLLIESGKPYVIENVPGSPLKNYVTLCGSMFGLKVIRHRHFECNPAIYFPPYTCSCSGGTASHRGMSTFKRGAKYITVAGNNYLTKEGKIAMNIRS